MNDKDRVLAGGKSRFQSGKSSLRSEVSCLHRYLGSSQAAAVDQVGVQTVALCNLHSDLTSCADGLTQWDLLQAKRFTTYTTCS